MPGLGFFLVKGIPFPWEEMGFYQKEIGKKFPMDRVT